MNKYINGNINLLPMNNFQRTIPAMFEASCVKYPDNNLLYEKKDGNYQPYTYLQIRDKVLKFADGLVNLGAKKGDRIALLAEGRSEWLISELAMLYIGVIDVPLSVKLNEPSELQFRLNHSGAEGVIVSARQLDKIRSIKAQLSELKYIIVIGYDGDLENNEISYNEVISAFHTNYIDEIIAKSEMLLEDDIANISYTSGTTADPKGIMLSHRNYTANVEQARTLLEIHSYYTSLLILPWDHSFAHTVGLYTLINNGASMSVVELGKTMLETLKNIPKNIKESKPTFLLSVPALAKNFRKNIEKGVSEKGAFTTKLFNHALSVAYKYNGNGWNKGKGLNMLYKPLVSLYDKILFSKIRASFGGRLEFFIGGGALLDIDLQKFFYAIGIPMYQGYGLSEAAPIISSNAPMKHKLGSSGFLVKPLDLKILDDKGNNLPIGEKGEIVVRGENVMKGYWKNDKATDEALKDGWLYTGDMGYLDSDGFLYVLGRFKSLLIGNDGEKYSPEGIEEAMTEQSVFIEQVMLYNNQNNYTIGLIYPNYSILKSEVNKIGKNISTEDGLKAATNIIKAEIDKYLPGGAFQDLFPHRWIPTAFFLIPNAFSEENKMINSTMKVVRGKVVENYKAEIDFLFTAEGKLIDNKLNIRSIKQNI